MRDRMERFVLLPFSIGCVSESSVAIGIHHDSRSTNKPLSSKKEEDEESLSSNESMKSSTRPLALPKPNISNGFQKLVKGFKTFFVYEEEEEEIEEVEMEIGDPTDVKHVTHIGWDGSSSSTSSSCPIQGWEQLISPSLSQFEFKPLVN